MVSTVDRLMTRQASDLMSQTLVVVPREMSLPAAAHLLTQAHVSGAPVVDEQGRCIGVLSNTDFLQYAEVAKGRPEPCLIHAVQPWQIVDVENNSGEQVADLMTKDPVTVPPHTPIRALARMMVDAHIHRIIVVDECQRPIGIVSSTDILAAVAQSCHEVASPIVKERGKSHEDKKKRDPESAETGVASPNGGRPDDGKPGVDRS